MDSTCFNAPGAPATRDQHLPPSLGPDDFATGFATGSAHEVSLPQEARAIVEDSVVCFVGSESASELQPSGDTTTRDGHPVHCAQDSDTKSCDYSDRQPEDEINLEELLSEIIDESRLNGSSACGSRNDHADSSGKARGSSCNDVNPAGYKRRRFTSKMEGCIRCGGPCPADKCFEAQLDQGKPMSDEESSVTDEQVEGDSAADAFAKAIEAHRKRQLTHSAVAAAGSSSAPAVEPPSKKRRTRQRKTRAPEGFGMVPAWLAKNPTIGKVALHPSHSLGWHRGLIWCWKCGHYGTAVPIKLKGKCCTTTLSGEKNLCRLRQGKPPSKVDWPFDET